MFTFREFFKFEWNRFVCKRNLIIFGVLFALVLGVTQYNVSLYEKKIKQKKVMVEFEKKRVSHFADYRFYGNYGFRVSVLNVPMDIWSFGTVPFPDIQADVDSSERLKIYIPLQGATAFSVKMKWFTDFSGILLLIGCILIFLYGFESYYHKKFLRYLESFAAGRRAFFSIALSRVILITLLCFGLFVFSYLIIVLNGIVIPFTWKLPVLFLTAIATASCFFALGAWFGHFKKMWVGLLTGGIIWFVSIFHFAAVIDMIVFSKANDITIIHEIELEKLITLSGFEKRSIQKAGKLNYGDDPTDIDKELAISFLKNEFKNILEHDQNMIDQMDKNVSLFKKLSMLMPTTNYLSINYELNTHGYQSLLAFYRNVVAVKRAFMNYFIDAVYFKENVDVKPFLADEEILLKYESQMTWHIPAGIIISLIIFLLLMTRTWYSYKKSRFQLPVKDNKTAVEEDIDMESGVVTPVDAVDDRFENQVNCLFSGSGKEFVKKGYRHKITLNDKDLKDNTERLDFLYLPYINNFPRDVKVGQLLDLVNGLAKTGKDRREKIIEANNIGPLQKTKIGDMEPEGLARVFLSLLDIRTFNHYIISDVTPVLPPVYLLKLKDRIADMAADDDANILLITSNPLFKTQTGKKGSYFNKNELFFPMLAAYVTNTKKTGAPDKSAKKDDGDE